MSLTQELLDLFNANIGGEDGPEYILEESGNDILWDNAVEMDREFMGESRWSNNYKLIYKIKPENRFVCVEYGQGKTENQPYSEIYDAYEVAQTEETIVVTKYVSIATK